MMELTFDGIVRQGFGFYNPNHAAALLCALFPFLWGWKKHAWPGFLATLLLTIPLVMTYSRTGVLVLFFELALYFTLTRDKNRYLIVAAAAGILLILALGGIFSRFTPDKALANRPVIWLAGLKLYAANPWGVGLGNSGAAVSNFMLTNIQCRTLVNSHLTLLTEGGLFAGFLWFGVLGYALLRGIGKTRTWCAVAGLCLSAAGASIFDWDLLSDFREFGGLPLLNFILSWLLLGCFLLLTGSLVRGKIRFRQLGIAAAAAGLCVILPLCLRHSQAPKLKDGIAYTSPEAPLVLYDEEWQIKFLLPYCGNEFQIPLRPGLRRKEAKRLLLFGNAAEYAGEFPHSRIVYVNPPEFFTPSENTEKIYLPKYDFREFPFPTERR